MSSVGLGVAAALVWGVGALFATQAARRISNESFAQWYLILQGAFLIPLLPFVSFSGIGGTDLLLIAGAGVLEAGASFCYGRALHQSEVGIVAPLISLEGAVAAFLGLVFVGQADASPTLVAGLLVASLGGVLAGADENARWSTAGAPLALIAATLFGGGLWLIAISSLEPVVAVFFFYLSASLILLAFYRGRGLKLERRGIFPLLIASLLSVAGFLTYAFGSRLESMASTAVIGAQFSVVAAIGGYLFFGERLTRRQRIAVPVVAVGVSLVAWATA